MMAFPEVDDPFKNLVNHVAIILRKCPITSNWSVRLFVCNICFSAIFSGFECGLAYPFPLLLLDPLQQHLNHSRHLVVASANAIICVFWWKTSLSATFYPQILTNPQNYQTDSLQLRHWAKSWELKKWRGWEKKHHEITTILRFAEHLKIINCSMKIHFN